MIYLKNTFCKLHTLIALFALIVTTQCAPLAKEEEATILSYEFANEGNGNYKYRFETSNGITREETGTLVNVGLPDEHIAVKGSYSYINSEGLLETVNYTADENGYMIIKFAPPHIVASPVPAAALATLLG